MIRDGASIKNLAFSHYIHWSQRYGMGWIKFDQCTSTFNTKVVIILLFQMSKTISYRQDSNPAHLIRRCWLAYFDTSVVSSFFVRHIARMFASIGGIVCQRHIEHFLCYSRGQYKFMYIMCVNVITGPQKTILLTTLPFHARTTLNWITLNNRQRHCQRTLCFFTVYYKFPLIGGTTTK